MDERTIVFEVTERIAVLSSKGGYTTELNKVSFNGAAAKLDLRRWRDGKPMKGIALTPEEARALRDALTGYDLDGYEL